MQKFKVGQKIRCISDNADKIEPGTILTIKNFHQGFYGFEGTRNCLYTEEIEPLNRTIRDVVIGDYYTSSTGFDFRVIDVAKNGIIDTDQEYITFDEMEDKGFTIKQPEQEKQEIEIAGELDIHCAVYSSEIRDNRNLIIELQKFCNSITEKIEQHKKTY